MQSMLDFFLTLFRLIILGVFLLSFTNKVRDIGSFRTAIVSFGLLPVWAASPFAFVVLAAELIVAATMLSTGKLLSWGFLLAGSILAIFSLALALVLIRKIDTSCNCFGASNDPVSWYDVVRNMGLIACSLGGYILSTMTSGRMEIIAYGLVAVVAITFLSIWLNLKSIFGLFAG